MSATITKVATADHGGWNHSICVQCWFERNPERTPTRVVGEVAVRLCCFCGGDTPHGIFVRHDPADPALFCQRTA